MTKLSYEATHSLERFITRKLIEYINKEVKTNDLFMKIDYPYPYFLDDENLRAKFNIWLCIDYKNENGETFIDLFLKNHLDSLSNMEREVLIGKKNSFISLFEIIDFDKEYIIILDLMQNKEYRIWEPENSEELLQGEFIFTRIGKILDEFSFIDEISYLPESVKTSFIDNFIIDYNKKRKNNPCLKIKEYLKDYSLSVINNYNNCIYEAIEIDEMINSDIYNELEEFESYIGKDSFANRHSTNLIDLFEYYLSDSTLSLNDLNKLDMERFFKDAIKDGFIQSQEEFNSYLNTLKVYTRFLSKKDPEYNMAYKNVLDISENRFFYMDRLNFFNIPFNINKVLESWIYGSLNEASIYFINDFDKFILYMLDRPMKLTSAKKNIKSIYLLELNEIFFNKRSTDKKTPSQKDFPLINLFYKIGLQMGLIFISGDILILTDKGSNFLNLRDEEKFSLLIDNIWNTNIFKEIINTEDKEVDKAKIDFIHLASSLMGNVTYDIRYLISKYSNKADYLFKIIEALIAPGMINSHYYPNYAWEVTDLGKSFFNYLVDKEERLIKYNLIELDDYRKI